jgi:DNA repair protein RecO (recombination protein O)
MLEKTRAISLHTIKYGDSGIVANVYTEQFGRQAYLIKNAFGKKAQIKANLFSPLNLLELEVYYKASTDLQKLKEANCFPVIQTLHSSNSKNAVAFFLAEVIYRSLREETPNPELFAFMHEAILQFDSEKTNFANFHLVFLMQMLKFTGFSPSNNYSEKNQIFDLLNSEFTNSLPLHGHFIQSDNSKLFSQLIDTHINNVKALQMNRELRQMLLEKLIEYYRLHIDGIGQIKSLKILNEIFS